MSIVTRIQPERTPFGKAAPRQSLATLQARGPSAHVAGGISCLTVAKSGEDMSQVQSPKVVL